MTATRHSTPLCTRVRQEPASAARTLGRAHDDMFGSEVSDGDVATATKEMCFACFDALLSHLNGDRTPPPAPAYVNHLCPLFVTWETAADKRLRGCIGTLTPRHLHGGLREYALHSGTRDGRFPPIERAELTSLACKLSLLHSYERARDFLDWDISVHGVTIEFEDENEYGEASTRSATYLPGVVEEQGWSKEEALASLMRKAGYGGVASSDKLRSLAVTRYRSSAARVTYDEYVRERGLPSSVG